MPKKAKAKAKEKAKAKAEPKAEPKAELKAEPKAEPEEPTEGKPLEPAPLEELKAQDHEPESPAAGSALQAVRQQREEPVASRTPEAEEVGEDLVDLSTIPDPWLEVSDEDALTRIKEEDWEVIEDGAASGPAQLSAKDRELQRLRLTEGQRQWLVSADLSENQLHMVSALGGPMWLRHLSLAMNPMESFDSLAASFPRLLVLDVSFIELSGAWEALAELTRLRRLVAEGCSVCSLEDLRPLPALQTLELNDNALEELEDLEFLTRCPKLLELDLRENEVVDKPGYAKRVAKLFPNLTWLDNQSRKKYVAKGADATYGADALREKEVAAVDGMFKNESCSCLEGNPCLDRATCKDWANREKVAAEARKRKGLRDDSGKML